MDRVETTHKFELLFPMQAFDCSEAAGLELIHQLTVPNLWQDQTRLPGPLFLSRLSLFSSERSVLYLGACRGRRFFDSLAFSADGGFRLFPRDFCRVPARLRRFVSPAICPGQRRKPQDSGLLRGVRHKDRAALRAGNRR